MTPNLNDAYWSLWDAAVEAARYEADIAGIAFGDDDLFLVVPAPPPFDPGICPECGRELNHKRWVLFPTSHVYDHIISCPACDYFVSCKFETVGS